MTSDNGAFNSDSTPSRPLVLLMRHAKSSWNHTELADFDRPLKKRGRKDAVRMARFLTEQRVSPQRIITSPAVRARDTAEILAFQLNLSEPEIEPRLYEADAEDWRQVLAELSPEPTLLIVGHNPGLEEFLGELMDGSVRMPTAAVACVALKKDAMFLTPESLEVLEVWRPKEL